MRPSNVFGPTWPFGPWPETGEGSCGYWAAAPANSSLLEVRGQWETGLGVTPEWKNLDWRSCGGQGLTDEAIHGGVRRAGWSGGEGSEGLSGSELEGLQRCTGAGWDSRR
jgi:hypothetical protein